MSNIVKTQSIGSNKHEIHKSDGTVILVSYSTPVAATLPDGRIVVTEQDWSVTTTQQINKWVAGRKREMVTQKFLNELRWS